MHELSITEALLDVVLRHARGAKALKVTGVQLTIGELSSYVDESIELFWNELSKDTIASGAQLHFHREPGRLLCLDCQREFPLATADFICPACGSLRARPCAGLECRVESIDIEPG